ncbi:MAG: hypothetical protein JO332_03000 [Planctomycetaceae bacterium]|nr:hypothetical protein [Planctomycetaceae bacterium]
MSKTLSVLGGLALVFAALAYPIGLIIGGTATEAYMIAGKDPTTVQVEQELFEPPKGASKESKEYRDAVLRIYGVPTDETTKVVFWPREKFIQPKQLPTITILPVFKEKGENPLQVKTVYFFALRAAIGAAVVGAVLLLAGRVTRKKAAPPAPPAAA